VGHIIYAFFVFVFVFVLFLFFHDVAIFDNLKALYFAVNDAKHVMCTASSLDDLIDSTEHIFSAAEKQQKQQLLQFAVSRLGPPTISTRRQDVCVQSNQSFYIPTNGNFSTLDSEYLDLWICDLCE
jgi:hypothetical protein